MRDGAEISVSLASRRIRQVTQIPPRAVCVCVCVGVCVCVRVCVRVESIFLLLSADPVFESENIESCVVCVCAYVCVYVSVCVCQS